MGQGVTASRLYLSINRCGLPGARARLKTMSSASDGLIGVRGVRRCRNERLPFLFTIDVYDSLLRPRWRVLSVYADWKSVFHDLALHDPRFSFGAEV